MEGKVAYENDLNNLKATELRLGLPGTEESEKKTNKRPLNETSEGSNAQQVESGSAPPSKYV